MLRTGASCGHFHLQEERAAEFGIALLERVLDARGRIRKEGMELVGNRLTSGEEHAEDWLSRAASLSAYLARRSERLRWRPPDARCGRQASVRCA